MKTASRTRPIRRTAGLAVAAAALIAATTAPAASAGTKDKQPMHDLVTGAQVAGAYSKLDRGSDAIAAKIRTTATPGHAVTVWYVIFNEPGNCSGGVCGDDDIFLNPADPGAGFNLDQIDAARISVVYGGDGAVVNPGNRLQLDGGLAVGEVPAGEAQIVIGHPDDGAMVGSPVTGLEDAHAAEVHIVLQDHGKAHEDPALRESQLTGFQGACNPDCADIQFAVHHP